VPWIDCGHLGLPPHNINKEKMLSAYCCNAKAEFKPEENGLSAFFMKYF